MTSPPLSSNQQDSNQVVAQLLQTLRLNPEAIIPPSEWIIRSPISLKYDRAVWDNYQQQIPWLSNIETLPKLKVVIDLDETLLLNSYRCPKIWEIGEGYEDRKIYPAYGYSQMKKPLRGRLQRMFGRTHYDTADKTAYPFLQNPRHIVLFRPGMLSGLAWLAQKGVELILVTASARQRVDYLLKRFPILKEVFGDHVISANEIMKYYLSLASGVSQIQDQASGQAFGKRPWSLAIKTPDLVNQILGNGGYDLIVDDSEMLIETIQETPLRALWVRPDLPLSNYGMQIVATIAAKVLAEDKQLSPERLEPDSQLLFVETVSNLDQFVRLEDPYYWPLCHGCDQLAAELITNSGG